MVNGGILAVTIMLLILPLVSTVLVMTSAPFPNGKMVPVISDHQGPTGQSIVILHRENMIAFLKENS